MVSNNINRLFIGLLLVAVVFAFFIFKLDLIFILILSILITYDLYHIKILNKNLILFISISTLILILLVPYILFEKLFFIESIIILVTILFNNLRKIFFTISVYIFILILFFIANSDRNILYLLIFISFFNDTLAYISGRFLGGPTIVPKISPNKTWSGTFVSFFATTTVMYFLNFNLIISIFLAISLFIGDIFFSYIKRHLKIKDFSSLLRSHGGILDRLDSMFICAIIFQIYIIYVK